jgi:phage gp29-like protein
VDLYDKLLVENVVADKLERRVMGLVSERWEVTPASDDSQDKAVADFIDTLLEDIFFDEICKRLSRTALLKGRAIEEIMWGLRTIDGVERVVPVEFKTRRVTRFQYDEDSRLRLRTPENVMPGELMPARKFIVHTLNPADDNPYGTGLGPALFWPVFFKRKGITFWMTFADKFGNPTAIGKYPVGAGTTEQNTLLAALAAIANDTGIIVPQGTEIELLEATRSGIDTYEKLCRYMDEMIARTIIGEADSSRDAGGALKAASDQRREVRADLLQADSDLLTITLDRHLFQPIVDFNFPGRQAPRVWRNFEPEDNLSEAVTVDKELHAMGYRPRDPAAYVADKYGGEWVYKAPQDPNAQEFMSRLKKVAGQLNRAGGQPPTKGNTEDTIEDTDFAEPRERDALDLATDRALASSEAAIAAMLAPIRRLVNESNSFAELQAGITALYGEMPTAELAEVMELALIAADAAGRTEIADAARAA